MNTWASACSRHVVNQETGLGKLWVFYSFCSVNHWPPCEVVDRHAFWRPARLTGWCGKLATHRYCPGCVAIKSFPGAELHCQMLCPSTYVQSTEPRRPAAAPFRTAPLSPPPDKTLPPESGNFFQSPPCTRRAPGPLASAEAAKIKCQQASQQSHMNCWQKLKLCLAACAQTML